MRKLFAGFLVAVILLGGDLIWRAAAQTNIFCANNLSCTVSALWNFAGGLQSGGVSVLTNPVNLATQVSGTLPGANYAAVNLAAGNVNGGATGVLPGANMAATNLAGGNNPGGVTGTLPNANLTTQGTDANLLTSGTVSASTGVALCTDANHGATTSGCTAGGVSEATMVSPTGVSSSLCTTTNAACNVYIMPNAHTLVRIVTHTTGAPSGCATQATFGIRDLTASSTIGTPLTPTTTGVLDSGAISVSLPAAHQFGVGVTGADAGCTTNAITTVTATYQ